MKNSPTSRRLAAIVSADVAGYARLMGIDEEGTLAVLRAHRSEFIDDIISDHCGRIVKSMGDGLLLEFPSVVEAVASSLEFQSGMARRNADVPPERQIEFRIGINLGDIIADGEDIFGDGVNIAARLEGLADPGGICLSEAAYQQVRSHLGLVVEDMGDRALKNIEMPVRAYRLRGTKKSNHAKASQHQAQTLPPGRPALAILPFRNLNRDTETGFVADGISLGIQTLLVQLSGIFFVNACAHPEYRRGEVTATQALSEMPVQYAIEGAVQKSGDRLRLNVQVSDLQSGAVILAETYDRDVTDVFALQDEIAMRIVSAVSVKLIGGHIARDFTAGLDSPNAWEHFLRGINHLYQWTRHDCFASIPHFEALAEAPPGVAIGPCYLALLNYMAAIQNWAPSREDALAEAQRWARRGVAIDVGNNGLAHAVMGAICLAERKHDEAMAFGRTGVAFRSSCPFALSQLGQTETYSGDPNRGIKHIREGMAVRMQQPPTMVDNLAMAFRDAGKIELSIPAAEEAIRIDPDYFDAYVTLCSDQAMNSDLSGAARTAEKIRVRCPDFSVCGYLDRQPYRNPAVAARIGEALRSAGLPG